MSRYVPAHLKHRNRRLLYDWITQQPAFSRAQASRATGISNPTVLRAVQFFLDRGIVQGSAAKALSGPGRTPAMLRFVPGFLHCAALHIEGRYATLGLVDMAGTLLATQKLDIENLSLPEILAQLPAWIAQLQTSAGIAPTALGGVGIGIPGALQKDQRRIDFAPLMGISAPYDCGRQLDNLSQALQVPVLMENDVNAAAWGAFTTRMDEAEDLLYCSLGTGLGAGVVIGGRLRRGYSNHAGEIGYTSFDPAFLADPRQPGWLEQQLGIQALASRYQFALNSKGKPVYQAGLIEAIAEPLAMCLANCQAVLDIDTMVLGGMTIQALGEDILRAVSHRMGKYSLNAPRLALDTLPEPGIIGLAALVSEQVLAQILKEDEVDNGA